MADILYPPSVRLMEDLEDQTVEAMFKTYGVIADKMLPPIVGPPYVVHWLIRGPIHRLTSYAQAIDVS